MRKMVLALLLAGVVTPAMAQVPPPADEPGPAPRRFGGPGMLMRADANGDGVVTREEAIAAADRRFDRLDADHDGTVTSDEMRAARDAMRGRVEDRPPPPPPADAGRPLPPREALQPMTREQSRARALEMFDRADLNKDGRVEGAELAAMRPMRGPGGDRRGADMPPPPPAGSPQD